MGAEVTISKHATPIDEWLEIENKLEGIDFQQNIHPHLGAWKFVPDDINPQQFVSLPLQIDLLSLNSILSHHEAYLVYAITNKTQTITQVGHQLLRSLINSVRQNIEETTLQVPIISGCIDTFEFRVYTYYGKLSKARVRLAALSYALKMQSLLNSKKKIAILSCGGVLRGKKLQKGSTIPILGQCISAQTENEESTQIDILHFFWNKRKKQNLLKTFKSKRENLFATHYESKHVAYNAAVKPPSLKLNLEPFSHVTYADIEEEQKKGELNTQIRATARHQLKKSKFQGECNQIVAGIYVSGQKVAKNEVLLQKHSIKAIINCAGDYCENWFQGKGITYLTFFLKDSQNQNIECLFYRAIQFIQTCQKSKKNVLVHCIQGISRSVTIVVAYLIFKLGYDYKKAELFIKQRRGVACPNNGFMVELIQFHKRLYEDFNSLPDPRVFLVSSHNKQTPNLITARLLKMPLFDSKKYVGLDCRGVYIVQIPDLVYIWVGSKCQQKKLKNYWSYAQEYVKKLQKYERASIKLKAISQGTEPKDFLSLWKLKEIPTNYEHLQYTKLFSEGQNAKPGAIRKFYQRQNEEQESSLIKLYIYPDHSTGLGVFDFQDLGQLSILVDDEGQGIKIYVCRQEQSQVEVQEFLEKVISMHYPQTEPEMIRIEQESLRSPSEELMSYFQ